MVLATPESKLCGCVTLMLLNSVNWKEGLRMFSTVIMFILKFVKLGNLIQNWFSWHLFTQDPKNILICFWRKKWVGSEILSVGLTRTVYCVYMQPSSKTKIWPQFAVWNFSARHCNRTWVLISCYVRHMFQGPLLWVLWWLRLMIDCCCLQSSSL
jgi:hypothetical protein